MERTWVEAKIGQACSWRGSSEGRRRLLWPGLMKSSGAESQSECLSAESAASVLVKHGAGSGWEK